MGKVHGSLARAGKVKSQTPKVSYGIPPGTIAACAPLLSCSHRPTSKTGIKRAHKTKKFLGRASREEEDPQGPREEENNLHTTIRQRHIDRWQAKGMDHHHHNHTLQPRSDTDVLFR